MLVVSIGGSPSTRSRSGVLLERSRQWLQDRGVEVVTFQVRDFPAEDLLHARFDSPHVRSPPSRRAVFAGARSKTKPPRFRASAVCWWRVTFRHK